MRTAKSTGAGLAWGKDAQWSPHPWGEEERGLLSVLPWTAPLGTSRNGPVTFSEP